MPIFASLDFSTQRLRIVRRHAPIQSQEANMKINRLFWLSLVVALGVTGAFVSSGAGQESKHQMTKADVDRLMTELSNWGRWGKDDQLGAINLITPAKRKQAAAMVKEGVSVS